MSSANEWPFFDGANAGPPEQVDVSSQDFTDALDAALLWAASRWVHHRGYQHPAYKGLPANRRDAIFTKHLKTKNDEEWGRYATRAIELRKAKGLDSIADVELLVDPALVAFFNLVGGKIQFALSSQYRLTTSGQVGGQRRRLSIRRRSEVPDRLAPDPLSKNPVRPLRDDASDGEGWSREARRRPAEAVPDEALGNAAGIIYTGGFETNRSRH